MLRPARSLVHPALPYLVAEDLRKAGVEAVDLDSVSGPCPGTIVVARDADGIDPARLSWPKDGLVLVVRFRADRSREDLAAGILSVLDELRAAGVRPAVLLLEARSPKRVRAPRSAL
ncbi:MAG TPA: hypothetical protein VNO22_18715 [Planctomycetota bacterium]|nr:hypothetical protein [Planctomycetota bacterium]